MEVLQVEVFAGGSYPAKVKECNEFCKNNEVVSITPSTHNNMMALTVVYKLKIEENEE